MTFAATFRRHPGSRRGPALRVPALLILAGVLAGCRQVPEAAAPDTAPEAPIAPVTTPAPAPVQRLTRNDLIGAAAQAASRFADGQPAAGPDPLVGRTFVVRIPFGCAGPRPATAAPQPGLAGWQPDAEGATIALRLDPADWSTAPMFARPDVAARWEAVEGFWIPRPWLASETCPQVVAAAELGAELPVSPQSVGLAAVHEAGGSRLGRRDGRAFVHVIRGSGGAAAPVVPAAGFQLVLEGRIMAFPGGRSFACHAAGPDVRPVCVAAVQLDRVGFEDGTTVLSEWRPG